MDIWKLNYFTGEIEYVADIKKADLLTLYADELS